MCKIQHDQTPDKAFEAPSHHNAESLGSSETTEARHSESLQWEIVEVSTQEILQTPSKEEISAQAQMSKQIIISNPEAPCFIGPSTGTRLQTIMQEKSDPLCLQPLAQTIIRSTTHALTLLMASDMKPKALYMP